MDSVAFDIYRPKTIRDIIGNSQIWQDISKKIENHVCPHLIVCGPAGTGKSTFMRTWLINGGYTVLTHNCIADSGLRDVRDSIRSFARGGIDGMGRHRWIILEHADSLTADTQAFLRRLLETASGSTRFIFEVRESGALSEPILSRCWLCAIDTPSQPEIRYEILRRTNNEISEEVATRISSECCGNVRIAVNQALALWKKCSQETTIGNGGKIIDDLWETKPSDNTTTEYGLWACNTIQSLRKQGADLRTSIRLKMPSNIHGLRVLSQWNRPGGASSRTLWLYAMCAQTN